MQILILPGFSSKNKDWAEEMSKLLNQKFTTKLYEWDHWTTGVTKDNWINNETGKILQVIKNNQVNILSKSIGTLVAMHVIKNNPLLINKLILSGIPLNDLSKDDLSYYNQLKKLDVKNIIVIQNKNDNHASYDQVKRFLKNINPKIKIISKPRDDHDYPYPDDFLNFFN